MAKARVKDMTFTAASQTDKRPQLNLEESKKKRKDSLK